MEKLKESKALLTNEMDFSKRALFQGIHERLELT
jgi:hypothetical protein